jgi:16S rRNA processing protein RimM
MTRDDCILLGSITKTYGIRGELILRTEKVPIEPEKNWGSIFLEIDGILVPFFIADVYELRDREWVIGFDDFDDRTRAEQLAGKNAWVLKELVEPGVEEVSFAELEGFAFHDRNSKKSGEVKAFMDIKGNPVLEVLIEGETFLVPAQDEFILELDAGNASIIMDLPAGLI